MQSFDFKSINNVMINCLSSSKMYETELVINSKSIKNNFTMQNAELT